jgi:hypothetical protein
MKQPTTLPAWKLSSYYYTSTPVHHFLVSSLIMLSHFRSSRSTTATPEGSVASIVSSTDTPSPPQKCGHTKPLLEYLADEEVPFALIPEGTRRTRFVVAITGATGATIAVRLLQALRALDIEVHLIMSKWAASTLRYETDVTVEQVSVVALVDSLRSDTVCTLVPRT